MFKMNNFNKTGKKEDNSGLEKCIFGYSKKLPNRHLSDMSDDTPISQLFSLTYGANNDDEERTAILVSLRGHKYENEICDVLRLFFEDMFFEKAEAEKIDGFQGLSMSSGIREENGQFKVEASLEFCNKTVARQEVLVQKNVSSDIFFYDESGEKEISESPARGKTPVAARTGENRENDYFESYESKLEHSVVVSSERLELSKSIKRELKRVTYLTLKKATGKELPWGMLTGIRPTKIVHEMIEKGHEKSRILEKLTQYFEVSGEKSRLAYNIALVEKPILDKSEKDKVGIYIGIPFCPTRCLYCSFTSNPISRYKDYVTLYLEALSREIEMVGHLLKDLSLKAQTIYMGGGTPTSINSEQLMELLAKTEDVFCDGSLEEFTLEAGRPDSIDGSKLNVVKNSKVTRISINPQSMNKETLNVIGRSHAPEDIIKTFWLAREKGFQNINMDIIAGLPGEDLEMFHNTLDEIEKLNPESLTVHTMSIKRASRLNEYLDDYELGKSELVSGMVDAAREAASKMGMHPYYLYRQKKILGNLENTGYCKPGFECLYNVHIMEEKQTIIALGAGGVTKVVFPEENRIERVFNVKSVEEYVQRVDEMVERKKKLLNQLR